MSRYIIVGTYKNEGAEWIIGSGFNREVAMEALCNCVENKLAGAVITEV